MSEPWCAVIVAHNHGATLSATLTSLLAQEARPERIVVVDCGSSDAPSWRDAGWTRAPGVEVITTGNLGFTGGNNLAWEHLAPREGWVLFLNPDVVLPPGLIRGLRERASAAACASYALLAPRLDSYSFAANAPSGTIDSAGVFPSATGWFDRRSVPPDAAGVETVPALCGAFLLARVSALSSCLRPAGGVFDERYFAYKEDIELSLRLRAAGWRVGLLHGAHAFHGRGWNPDRTQMPRRSRLLSARNELRLHATYAPWRLPVSAAKWLLVALLNR